MRYEPDFRRRDDGPAWSARPTATIAMDGAGLILGAGTRLVRRANDGRLALAADHERLLALLSVAAGRPVAHDVLPPIKAAEATWQSGDKALANFRLLFADLPRLHGSDEADHLRVAEHLLDRGTPP